MVGNALAVILFSLLMCTMPSNEQSQGQLDSDSNGNSVQFTQTILGENRLRITCEVRGRNVVDNLVILNCPVTQTRFCYQNCIDPCRSSQGEFKCRNDQISPIRDCKYTAISEDHVRVEYDLKIELEHRIGQWWCTSRGQESNRIFIQYNVPAASTKNTTTQKVVSKENEVSGEVQFKENGSKHQTRLSHAKALFFRGFTREVIILLIVITSCSVFLCLFFYIQCIVVKRHLKQQYLGGTPNACIGALFCVDKLKPRSRVDALRSALHHPVPQRKPVSSAQTLVPLSTSRPHSAKMPLTAPTTPLTYRYAQNQPIQFVLPWQKPVLSGQEGNSSRDLIYDEVPDSVYTTSGGNQVTTLVKTPDGHSWILDHKGRVYLPYGLVSPSGDVEILQAVQTASTPPQPRHHIYTPLEEEPGQNQLTGIQDDQTDSNPIPSSRRRPVPLDTHRPSLEEQGLHSSSSFESVDPATLQRQRMTTMLEVLKEETSSSSLHGTSYDMIPTEPLPITYSNFCGAQAPILWCDDDETNSFVKIREE